MRILGVIICWLILNPSLTEIRSLYVKAADSQESADKLYQKLAHIKSNSTPVLVGYKAASLTLMAKNTKGAKHKKEKFKEGAVLLGEIIKKHPNHIELRLIRLSIQENAPKVLKYKSNIKEDAAFIHQNYSALKNKALKAHILGYVLASDAFTSQEKEVFSDR